MIKTKLEGQIKITGKNLGRMLFLLARRVSGFKTIKYNYVKTTWFNFK